MYTLYICNTYDLNPKYLPQLSARPAMGSTMVSIKPLAPRRERFMSSTPMPLGTDVERGMGWWCECSTYVWETNNGISLIYRDII